VPRPVGSRNRDYEESRHALAFAVAVHLLRPDGEPATFKDLAAAAGVSAPTLRHYFGDHEGAYRAAMAAVLAESRPYLERLADAGAAPPEESLPALLRATATAWRVRGFGRVFAAGLVLGLERRGRGPAFLGGVLEPALDAAERVLAAHVERGELPAIDVRAAALGLVAPVVLALLHQDNLGGHATRALDVEAFIDTHAATMLAGLRG
jgi:AcrR family transcriptional regulator